MGTTLYVFFFLLIAFVYGVNPNKENDLGTAQSTPKGKVVEEKTEIQETAPYFTKAKKMSRFHTKPAGNMIILKCKAGGYPTPNITWYKNKVEPTRHLGNIRYGQWSLVMEDLIVGDSGDYKCVICNYLGCIDFTYSIAVVERIHHRPIITTLLQNKTVIVGSNVTFNCEFISDLNPHIYWITGKLDENNVDAKTITSSQNPEILELFDVTHDSEKWYSCVVANTLGSTSSSAYLKVVDAQAQPCNCTSSP